MPICEHPYLPLFECLPASNRYAQAVPPMYDTKMFAIMSPTSICVEHPLDFRPLFHIHHRHKAFNPHISCHSLAGEIDEKMGLAVPGSSALVGAILPTSRMWSSFSYSTPRSANARQEYLFLITSLNSMTSIY